MVENMLAGLARARGKYACFLHDDDRWSPSFLTVLTAGLERYPQSALAFCDHHIIDDRGIVVDSGLRIAPKARGAFVTPSHQFPTGVALSVARRLELLAWARASGSFVIEDDYTSEFRYSGPPLASLQGLDDDERVIYVGTLNKALFPGLRMGYAVLPQVLLPAFASARYLMDRQSPTLLQAVVAEFMQQGHFGAHIRRMRQVYRDQRDALVAILTRRAPENGLMFGRRIKACTWSRISTTGSPTVRSKPPPTAPEW